MLLNDLTVSQLLFAKDSLAMHEMADKILAQKFQKSRTKNPCSSLVCSNHLRKLLDGYVLSYHDLIDLCSLRDDATEVLGYRTSLEIIFRNTKDIQEIKPILHRLWRRILLATEYFIFLTCIAGLRSIQKQENFQMINSRRKSKRRLFTSVSQFCITEVNH